MTIQNNTFAAACYDQNSIEDLVQALSNGPDATDMATWGLTEDEWREQVQLALDAKRADLAD